MGWSSSIRSALGGGQSPPPSSDERDAPPLVIAPSAPVPEPKPSGAPRFEAFDPTALERGVAAIRELNTSPHAGHALDLMKEQEKTKQLQMHASIEQQRMQNNQFAKNAQMEMEEIRKRNEAERLNEEKQAALYKAKVQQKLEQQKLEDRRQYDQEQRQKQHDLFLSQESIRRENDAAIEKQRLEARARQARIDQETIRVKEAAAAEGRIKQERENEDVQLRRMEKEAAATLAARLESIRLHYQNINQIGASLKEAVSDPRQCAQGVALVTALSLGFFGARTGTRVAGNYISARLGRPQLVRETSRRNWLAPSTWFSLKNSTESKSKAINQVVMSPALRSRLTWIADTAHSATLHNSPYRHLLLHGPPGTGKTLFARALALDSHMDYAIVSGGDLSQLGNAAVTELHKLFDWAEKSPRGAVLFFDEADSFLRKGRDDSSVMSEQGRHILSAFLQRTGTESRKFMIVLASNMDLSAFDDAVKDRIDEFVEFEIPNDDQRKKMISLFLDQYLKVRPSNPLGRWWKGETDNPLHEFSESDVHVLSQKLDGYSGRQIAKFIISLRAAVFGNLAPKANLTVAEQLLSWKEFDSKATDGKSDSSSSKIIDV